MPNSFAAIAGTAPRQIPPRPASRGRLPELDGLRGFAILLVVLFHYVADTRNNPGHFGLLYKFAQFFRLGWSGVDLFFVLSGFLIGGILLDARAAPNYFRVFYTRRFYRILPVYYAWITAFAMLAFLAARIAPAHAAAFASPAPLAVYYLFLQNFAFAPLALVASFWLAPMWSLAVEEQFYLIVPWLIRFASRKTLVRVLLACLVGAPVLRAIVFSRLAAGSLASYYLMPCRADSLAAGMLLAIAWRGPAREWFARHCGALKLLLAALAGGALAMIKWLPQPRSPLEAALQYSWLAALYSCLMAVALAHGAGLIARLARWRFLREWGRVSYCLYLIHAGILLACSWLLLDSGPRITDWRGAGVTLLALGVSWLIASASWRYFEKPLMDRGHRARYAAPESSRA